MRLMLLLIASLSIFSGCNKSGQNVLGIDEYFKLDSLLDQQIELLADSDLQFTKRVSLDGNVQEQTFRPDTARLSDEFRIFRELDLNKTNYVGAFDQIENDSIIRYDLRIGQKSPVKFLEIRKDNDRINLIKGMFLEEKEIYQHKRAIEINFTDNRISGYSVKGFQDMVMKDTVFFETEVMIN